MSESQDADGTSFDLGLLKLGTGDQNHAFNRRVRADLKKKIDEYIENAKKYFDDVASATKPSQIWHNETLPKFKETYDKLKK